MSHSHTHHPAAIHNSLMHQMCNAVVENTPPTHQYHLDSPDFSCCTHSSLSYCLNDPLPNLELKWSTKSTGAVVLKIVSSEANFRLQGYKLDKSRGCFPVLLSLHCSSSGKHKEGNFVPTQTSWSLINCRWTSEYIHAQNKNPFYLRVIISCSYIHSDTIFRIGTAQIQCTFMNKLGSGERISWINRIWLSFNLQCRS